MGTVDYNNIKYPRRKAEIDLEEVGGDGVR
jgi:hypothetical protein